MPERKTEIDKEAEDLKTYWQDRNTQMQEDRDLINLLKPVKKTDIVQWVSNEPKVFYDTSVALVSSYPPRFRMPLTINFTPDEKRKMSKAERFTLGVFRELDNRQYNVGKSYWLRELAYWVLSGWYSNFNAIENRNGQPIFIADHWDPMTVYPMWDSNELIKCIRYYQTDKQTALMLVDRLSTPKLKKAFVEPSKDTDIRVTNYWKLETQGGKREVINAISISGQIVKDFKKEPFDCIPIHIGAIGNPERTSSFWKKTFGENIIAANRDMYEYQNVILSLMVTIMAETAYQNIITKTRAGNSPLPNEGVRGFGQIIPLKIEESIELLKHASTPEEALQALQYVTKQAQKGSIPDIVYGGVPVQDISGFAISQLMAAIKYKISPYLNTMQHVMGNVASSFQEQFRNHFDKVTLTTTNPTEIRKGLFFVEEFTKDDIPETTHVEVTIPLTSAIDKTQQILFSRQALSPPQLLSRETLWDEVLGVQDSEQEYARILQDETLEMPIVKQIMMIEQLRIREQAFVADGRIVEARALHGYILALEMQLGMREGIPEVPGQKSPGVSPQFSPPEAGGGGTSPDMMRAALGVGSPGLSRPPQTPEQRQANVGRRAGLVNRTGEML